MGAPTALKRHAPGHSPHRSSRGSPAGGFVNRGGRGGGQRRGRSNEAGAPDRRNEGGIRQERDDGGPSERPDGGAKEEGASGFKERVDGRSKDGGDSKQNVESVGKGDRGKGGGEGLENEDPLARIRLYVGGMPADLTQVVERRARTTQPHCLN